jgi:hypothetical protein
MLRKAAAPSAGPSGLLVGTVEPSFAAHVRAVLFWGHEDQTSGDRWLRSSSRAAGRGVGWAGVHRHLYGRGRSRRFYTAVLGGETVRKGEPTYVVLANSWIIINLGGGPTDDKPTVMLETPREPDRASSFLNIRVADVEAVYATWSSRGTVFLTPPIV